MKLSFIQSFLVGKVPYEALKLTLSKEIDEYKSSAKEKGKTMPVYVDEDTDILFAHADLNALGDAFLNGELDEIELNYLADALLLSNRVKFESDQISDKLGYFTDPEVNGQLTKEIVAEILTR